MLQNGCIWGEASKGGMNPIVECVVCLSCIQLGHGLHVLTRHMGDVKIHEVS